MKAKAASGEKKPNIFKRMGRKIKEVFSELKKVTWPTFGKAVKQTCVVLVVTVIFLVVIMFVDWGLGALLKLITSIGA